MNPLIRLNESLAFYVKDASPIPEADIVRFVSEHNISLRVDHLKFLSKFSGGPGERLHFFKAYGGDFDFEMFKRVCLEYWSDMITPHGCTYFGSSFVGDGFCIEYETGKIFAYDDEKKYGLVHESLDGFLLRALLTAYMGEAFSEKAIKKDLAPETVDDFRLINAKGKLVGATSFDIEYQNIDSPSVLSEYYLVGDELIVVYPLGGIMVVLGGEVLDGVV